MIQENKNSVFQSIMRWLATAILTIAVLYLVVINVALNLPATRAMLNALQPEHLSLSWGRAWSLYPLRVALIDLAADGQTATEQWQVDAHRAAASVSLLPLLRGEIRIHALDLETIDLRLRPRPHPAGDTTGLADYYPVIRNRDPHATAEPEPTDADSSLILEIDDLHVKGEHAFWVSHIRGRLPGEVRGSVRVDTQAGQLELSGGAIDLALASLRVGPEEPVTHDAVIRGQIDVPAFRLADAKGPALLRLPELDAEIDLPVQDLEFLTWIAPVFSQMGLNGAGRLRGRLIISAGEIRGGTDLVVEARKLGMKLGSAYRFSGDGRVEFKVDPTNEAQADLTVLFDQVTAELESPDDASRPKQQLFSGQGLRARLHVAEVDPNTTSTATKAEDLATEVMLQFHLDLPAMTVADISAYNRLLPPTWDIALLGGTGSVNGRLTATDEQLTLNLNLASDDVDLQLGNDRANADLLLALHATIPGNAEAASDQLARLTLNGTELKLLDVAVGADLDATPTWSASMQVTQSDLQLPSQGDRSPGGTIRDLILMLADQGFGPLLAAADGKVSAAVEVSDLDWIAELLDRPLGLRIAGTGAVDAQIVLKDGLPSVGSEVRIPPRELAVSFLDYRIEGNGRAHVELERIGSVPQARVALNFDGAEMRGSDDPEPGVTELNMETKILVRDPFAQSSHNPSPRLSLMVHSAHVPNMASLGAYVPNHAGASILDGTASLVGNLDLAANAAAGEFLLETHDLRVSLADAVVSGDLTLELLIRDGSSETLHFDISGSSLAFEDIKVLGSTGSATEENWHARLQLEHAEIGWQKPMQLDTKAYIRVKDTRPFVALLDSARERHGWISELLAVKDLAGHVEFRLDEEKTVLQDFLLSGPELGLHAKALSRDKTREALLLVRWRNIAGLMALHDAHKHFSLSKARERFDTYQPGQSPLPFLEDARLD